jgi:hypothetical protein
MAVPAHVRCLQSHRVASERSVEAAHRAGVRVGPQHLLGEARAAGAASCGHHCVRGEFEIGEVQTDRCADRPFKGRREVLVEQDPRGRGPGPGVREDLLDLGT